MRYGSWVGGAALIALALVFAKGGAAQPNSVPGARTAAAGSGSYLITLGSGGGGWPGPDRAHTSTLLSVNGKLYLIDAGEGVTRRLAQSGVRFSDIGEIFLTDHHGDHVGGLAHLLNTAWEWARRAPIHVYGPPGTGSLVKTGAGFTRSDHEVRWMQGRPVPLDQIFIGKDVAGGLIFRDENVSVTVAEHRHTRSAEAVPQSGMAISYSYRFESPGRILVFTGDSAPSGALTELASGADLLVAEVTSLADLKQSVIRDGIWLSRDLREQQTFIQDMLAEHLTPEKVGEIAARASVKTLLLTRLSPASAIDDHARYSAGVAQHFPGRVLIARDRMRLDLPHGSCSAGGACMPQIAGGLEAGR